MATIRIEYQSIWVDFKIGDGTYTPKQLRAAGLVTQHDDRVQTYELTWPGGETRPPVQARQVFTRKAKTAQDKSPRKPEPWDVGGDKAS